MLSLNLKKVVKEELGEMEKEKAEIFDEICGFGELFYIDKEELQKIMRKALEQYKYDEYSGIDKVIDAILYPFGLTTTPRKGEKMDMKQSIRKSDVCGYINKIDEKLNAILSSRQNLEKDVKVLREETARLTGELNAVNTKLAEFDGRNKKSEQEFVSNMQKILASRGKDAPLAEEDPINRMLEDFSMGYSWDFEAYPEMFSVYIISNPDRVGIRQPAILRDNKLLSKGLVYKLEEADEDEEAPEKAEEAPGEAEKAEEAPGDAEEAGEAEEAPEKAEEAPGEAEKAEEALGDAEEALGDAEEALGDAEEALGDAEEAGEAEEAPEKAEEAPGEAEEAPEKAEEAPGDASAETSAGTEIDT